jgi:hypothetical protein
VELRVVQASSTVAEVMMGERKIVHVKRGRVLDVVGSGRRTRWEVEIAEGVDLLLVSFFPCASTSMVGLDWTGLD